jgi:hypothetical protein
VIQWFTPSGELSSGAVKEWISICSKARINLPLPSLRLLQLPTRLQNPQREMNERPLVTALEQCNECRIALEKPQKQIIRDF